ncbi:DUF1120 domain-containing protein [Enterobacter sp.]|uniref:DUF1120 domain-containing protein n=1 Tax=Enterobacter sp. TaxID=42895 RepID=UPI00296EB2D1|nr:DUF1120 domain-containing protein [Enterobacter sp.]
METVFKKTLLASVMVMASASAFATDSADLKVTGTINAPACTPEFDGGGTVDFGVIPIETLSITSDTMLPDYQQTKLKITCDAPTRFGFTVLDGKADSVPPDMDDLTGNAAADYIAGNGENYNFGLGMTKEGGTTIGVYAMRVSQTQNQQTEPLKIIHRPAQSQEAWSDLNAAASFIQNGPNENVYSFSKSGESTPSAETEVTATLNIYAAINDMTTMPVTETVTLDGLSTFTLVYL